MVGAREGAVQNRGRACQGPLPLASKRVTGSVTRARSNDLAALETVLRRQGAAMEAWQVAALVLGALASTNLRLGPQHLLSLILGEKHAFANLDEAPALLGALMTLWNDGARAMGADRGVTLSAMGLAEAPSREELTAYAARRAEELRCFVRGIDAGGDDPAEFGEEGAELFTRLGEARAFYGAYGELLARIPENDTPAQRAESGRMLCALTTTVEALLADLLRVGQAVRAEALAVFGELADRGRTDDGVRRGPGKVGRNASCPCGSGQKYKRCCARTVPTSH